MCSRSQSQGNDPFVPGHWYRSVVTEALPTPSGELLFKPLDVTEPDFDEYDGPPRPPSVQWGTRRRCVRVRLVNWDGVAGSHAHKVNKTTHLSHVSLSV